MKEGAYDYLTKPVDLKRLKILLDKIVERLDTVREVKALRRQLREHGTFGPLIGSAPEMRKLYQIIEQAAPTSASVLIMGESGTGKELVAQTIHQLSPRGAFPFVAINCAAIPETLLESEIFGHEKGAFTGAADRRAGCFELADHGTLFLDEIGEMTPATQVKLLRVLQERTFRRLGGRQEQSVDVRVIAATNIDPAEAVQKGRLREDLYYRLNVFAMKLPTLRDRKEDLPLLIQSFINEFNARNQRSIAGVDHEAMRLLEHYQWPGNVRELRNVIERAVLLAETPEDEDALRRTPMSAARSEPSITATPSHTATSADAAMTVPVDVGIPFKLAKQNVISEFEKRYISRLLAQHDGNISAAARAAGIDRMSIHKMLHRLGLANPGRE
jgi:DNA-binding NtrC family response regulator